MQANEDHTKFQTCIRKTNTTKKVDEALCKKIIHKFK